ncbi:uncharacterized protein LOC142750998 isoform X2 [Rhinoderma darwinii]|uniref:uncharacterized protein LOC142750998 isoform X2 n=1 Tax=Rhinoderma darwinii TaxID=43563 RepID=UPI003F67A439
MQNIKKEPVDVGADSIGSTSQEQYYPNLEDTDFKQENERDVDKESRIVSVSSTREDHGVTSLLHVWSDDRIFRQVTDSDENNADGNGAQVFALLNKRKGCQNDHQVPSKKLISDRARTSISIKPSLGIHANEVGRIQEAHDVIAQHGVYQKDQLEFRRYKPQMLQLQTRFTGDSIFNRSSKRGRPTSGKCRKVCKDIICMPAEYPEDDCTYRVPRGKEREQLAMLGLVGKILIQSSWNFENFRTEVVTLFRKYFSCSEEEFSFNFLQCLPGNRKLIKPNVSATFKWSGIAIISLAAQGSLYIKTPHTLAAPAKNLFLNTKQRLPDAESENINKNIHSDRQKGEISQPGDPNLRNSVYQMDEKDSQHCPLEVPLRPEQASDDSVETQSNTGQRLAEKPYRGLTKEMCEVPQHSGSLLMVPADKISTGNISTKHHTEGKSCHMANNFIFTLLRDAGIKTALVGKVSDNKFVTSGCEPIPIALGCWRIATGMYLKRNPDAEGRRLYPPRIEMFYKHDVCEDVCSMDQLLASKINCAGLSIGQSQIDVIHHSLVAIFEIVEKACLAAEFILVNMKVQFGVDLDSKEIVLSDVIEYNCWHQSQLEDRSQQDDNQNLLSPKGEGRVVVLMESVSYLEHCEKMKASCAKYSIPCELRVSSAYTGPGETLDIKSQYEDFGFCTVVSPEAAAQFSAHILGLTNPQLWSKLRSCTLNKWISVKQADEKLRHCSM